MAEDESRFMTQALGLARRAEGKTAPNPLVGAVVVNRGRVVGSGYHKRAGSAHAEAAALRSAGARARGGTLFVTLEPCDHHGRTPPCTEALIRSGIARVVIGARDPNPISNGRGLKRLRGAGIQVRLGLLSREARALNLPFEKAMTRKLPMVIAKVGQSLDGKLATVSGESRWITSVAARRLGHVLRGSADAIVVGINTVLKDDPRLSARGVGAASGKPAKVILDSHLRIPLKARCLQASSAALVIIATVSTNAKKRQALERKGAEVWVFKSVRGRVPLTTLFKQLAARGLQMVLIEGGGEVLASAFAERLVDRVVWCVAPILIGGRTAPTSVAGSGVRRLSQAVRIRDIQVRRVGGDVCIEGKTIYPKGR